MATMKTGPKVVLIAAALGAVAYGVQVAKRAGYIPAADVQPSAVPQKITIPTPPPVAAPAPVAPVAAAFTPATTPSGALAPPSRIEGNMILTGPEVRFDLWEWNAQAGLILAVGGATTAPGSLLADRHVRVKLLRQDDTSQMQADLVAFANAYAGGDKTSSDGVHFVVIMGDGAAQFLAGVNGQLQRLGPGWRAQVVGALGYSYGEDKFMAPPAVKDNPQAARGMLIAGVLRDGDWNIAQKWAGDNGLCNNPDETTYDPTCLNWVNAADYIDAAQKYISGNACEDRPKKGSIGKAHVCVTGVVTWTPGDVDIATKRGGLVPIVSTREYNYQMPAVVIGLAPWMTAHPVEVRGILSAALEAGAQIKADDAQLRRAMLLSAALYHDQDGAYWYRYFQGVTEKDATGLAVQLGGSRVNNLADTAQLFAGDEAGKPSLYASVYTVFGKLVHDQYPKEVPSVPAYAEAVDLTYLRAVMAEAPRVSPTPVAQEVTAPDFTAAAPGPVKQVVGRRNWSIAFDTGKATFRPDALPLLDQMYDQLAIAGNLAVELHGHTDNTGVAAANQTLSERRAFAVRDYLTAKNPAQFPPGRVRVFSHGQTQPIASNDQEAGRAQNRRVEVVIGVAG